jgi:hypothetical protein
MSAEITMSCGRVALVDAADLAELSKLKWSFGRCGTKSGGYAYAYVGGAGYRKAAMHRLILGAVPGQLVDHINGDGLDNRRANLRFATKSQNSANSHKASKSACGFRGVHRRHRRFRAYIQKDGRQRFIGSYATAEEAARAYDAEATKLFGEFATINFAVAA